MAAPDVKVRITAEDNATATVVGLQQRFRAFRESSEEAGRGLNKVGNALGDMAREAVGASGPLGRILEKIIEFGAGGGAFIVVAGAIALAYKAFEKLEENTKAAHKAWEDFLNSVRKQSPLALLGGELDAQRETLEKMERDLAARNSVWGISPEERAALERQRALVATLTGQYQDLNAQLRTDAQTKGGEIAAKARTDAAKAEADALRKRNEEYQKWLNAPHPGANEHDLTSDRTRQGASAAEQQAGVNAANAGGVSWAMIGAGGERVNTTFATMSDHLKAIGTDLKNFGTGAQNAFDAAAQGAQLFGLNLGGVKKGLGLYAAVHGAYDEVLAISAFARGLFGDPTQFKAAAAAQASALRWFSLASKYGAGGGGNASYAASGGNGGLSATGFQSQQQAAQNRDTLNVVLQKGYISSTDPDFQDWLATTLNNATGRGVTITVSGVAA